MVENGDAVVSFSTLFAFYDYNMARREEGSTLLDHCVQSRTGVGCWHLSSYGDWFGNLALHSAEVFDSNGSWDCASEDLASSPEISTQSDRFSEHPPWGAHGLTVYMQQFHLPSHDTSPILYNQKKSLLNGDVALLSSEHSLRTVLAVLSVSEVWSKSDKFLLL